MIEVFLLRIKAEIDIGNQIIKNKVWILRGDHKVSCQMTIMVFKFSKAIMLL